MDKCETSREQWPELMARAQAGNQQAYTQLLKALVPVIRSVVRRQIADDVLVEDVIQDVLLSIHRVRHTYDPACPFLPWLLAIAQARSIDALRRRGRRHHWEVEDDAATQRAPDIAPALGAERLDRQQQLTAFLSQLPERQRQIVEHVHLREMSLAEAAAQNNLSVSAVKSLLHRALTHLRRFGAHHDRS